MSVLDSADGLSRVKLFYVTTPIYYANAHPHLGNAYTSFIADFYARAKRMIGYTVKFSTGTDENGQKMTQKAAEQGKSVMDFLDEIAQVHKNTRDGCRISYTDFIRTTHPDHHAFVQKMLQKTFDAGAIYQGSYEGLYCVGCEGFKKESDLIEQGSKKVCPDHLVEPDHITENNRFFTLKNHTEQLQGFYKHYKNFCSPSFRFNEILSFVEQGLEDFSISREGSNFGVQLPFDDNAVTYIWFDALYNYLTVCQGGDESFWTQGEVLHTLGKDISRFHAIYRPAMLIASDQLPKGHFKGLINGFFTIDGQKMSKSLGNIVDPVELIAEHGRDPVVYYLFSDIIVGNDGDFSFDRLLAQKDSLMKTRGNLVSRVVTLAKKYEVESVSVTDSIDSLYSFAQEHGLLEKNGSEIIYHNPLFAALVGEKSIAEVYNQYFTVENGQESKSVSVLLHKRYELVQWGNAYIQHTTPWESAKENLEQAQRDLQVLVWLIKGLGVLSAPFLIEAFEKLQTILIIDHPERKNLQTDKNNPELGSKFQEIIALHKFDTLYGESKYLY